MTGSQQPPPYLTAPAPSTRQQPAAALRALAAQLRAAGITHLYSTACILFGVLSITHGLTVWTNGRLLWWQARDDAETTWPAADPHGAARILTTLATSPGPERPDRP